MEIRVKSWPRMMPPTPVRFYAAYEKNGAWITLRNKQRNCCLFKTAAKAFSAAAKYVADDEERN